MEFDPAFVEREYNNRRLVPDHPAYFARWQRDSEFVRATLPCSLDVTYGTDPRHRIDLFPAANARGTLIFFHGGYWRSLDKDMFSWLAAAWVAAGVNVAMPNYRLVPAVRIDDIIDDAIAASNFILGSESGVRDEISHEAGIRNGFSRGPVVLCGHSAGGHLTAALLAAPRSAFRFDLARIAGGVAISGIVDFEPLRQYSFNSEFKLDEAGVRRLNLHDKRPTIAAPLVVAVGGSESAEFLRQSRLLAQSWKPAVKSLLLLPGLNHFSVVDAFAERGQPLYEETLALF